jgi:hypothetical protein
MVGGTNQNSVNLEIAEPMLVELINSWQSAQATSI